MKTAVKVSMALFAGALRRLTERVTARVMRTPPPVKNKEPRP